jgi:hypothetical protein
MSRNKQEEYGVVVFLALVVVYVATKLFRLVRGE